jgi:hypothetical protein
VISSDPEDEFARLLTHKFGLFKALVIERIEEPEKALAFSQEEAKRIAEYLKESYFKHIKLYDYVLNNKQLSEVKRILVNVNEPLIAPSLSDALLLGAEEALAYEEDVEAVR